MKKSVIILIILIVLSSLPFIHMFLSPDLPHTSDGEVQIPRMAAFYKAIRDGHIPVRWAGDLNYGYGMPLFTFIYHTPFYISSFFIALGVPLVSVFKLTLYFSFILSGAFMFLFAKTFFKSDKIAFLVALLYQFAPYHLVDVLIRGAIGTIYVYAFFPLVLWGCLRANIPIIAVSLSLMILSHNSMALVFFFIALGFLLLFAENKQKALFGVFLGLGLSSFYWIPALIEHKYTYGDLFMKDLFRANFPQFHHFFIPNLFNDPRLRVSEIVVHWGIAHTVLIFLAIVSWKSLQSKMKIVSIFCFALIIISLFFMHPLSTPIWERVSYLRQFQFPWRLLSVIVFATSMLGGVAIRRYLPRKPSLFILLSIMIVLPTMYYWKPTQGYDRIQDEQIFWNYPLNTTYFGETDVIWSAGPATAYPKSRVEIIEGEGRIDNFRKINHKQTFSVEATKTARIVSHTQYFPGWRVYINGEKTPIQFQDPNWRGLITFLVPEGTHAVRIQFEETPIRLIANVLSLGSILIIMIFFLKHYICKRG